VPVPCGLDSGISKYLGQLRGKMMLPAHECLRIRMVLRSFGACVGTGSINLGVLPLPKRMF
jgi:hypothetical protein